MMLLRSKTNNKAKCERQRQIFNSQPANYKPYYICNPRPKYSGGFCDETSWIEHVTYNNEGQKFFRIIAEARNEEAKLIVVALNEQLARSNTDVIGE